MNDADRRWYPYNKPINLIKEEKNMSNSEKSNDFYLVRVEEILARTVKIDKSKAGSLEEAEDYVRGLYRNGDIVLDSDDFFDKEITAREVENENLSLFEDVSDLEDGYVNY